MSLLKARTDWLFLVKNQVKNNDKSKNFARLYVVACFILDVKWPEVTPAVSWIPILTLDWVKTDYIFKSKFKPEKLKLRN